MKRLLVAFILALCNISMLNAAEDLDFQLSVSSPPALPGSIFRSAVFFSNFSSDGVSGWQFGICHDSTAITLTNAFAGSATNDLNGGGAVDFESIVATPEGYTNSTQVSFTGLNTLAPGQRHELMVAYYENNLPAGTATSIQICDTLGTPPVEVSILVSAVDHCPSTSNSTLYSAPVEEDLTFSASTETVVYDRATGTTSSNVSVDIVIEDLAQSPVDSNGCAIIVGHDPNYLAPVSIELGPIFSSIDGGSGPAYLQTEIFPDGIAVSISYSLAGHIFIEFSQAQVAATIHYSVNASSLLNNSDGITTAVTPLFSVDDLFGYRCLLAEGGLSMYPTLLAGSVSLVAAGNPFVRGDCNNDLVVNIADGIALLQQLFSVSSDIECLSACDANCDEAVDQSDAVFIFYYRFLNGMQPAAPFPSCDISPGSDCESHSC